MPLVPCVLCLWLSGWSHGEEGRLAERCDDKVEDILNGRIVAQYGTGSLKSPTDDAVR